MISSNLCIFDIRTIRRVFQNGSKSTGYIAPNSLDESPLYTEQGKKNSKVGRTLKGEI